MDFPNHHRSSSFSSHVQKAEAKYLSGPYGHLKMLAIVFKTKINSTRSAFQEFIAQDHSENTPEISFQPKKHFKSFPE